MTDPQSPSPKPAEAKPAPPAAPAAAPAAPSAVGGSAAKSILTNIPVVLTAIGGVIAAIATLISSADKAGWLRHPTPTLEPTIAAVATLVAATPQPTFTLTTTPTELSPTSTPLPPPPSPTVALPEGVTLMDDFSDPTPAWDVGADGTYEVNYQDGEYRIVVNEADSTIWGSPTKPYDLADFALEVDARQLSGPQETAYGVLVRVQPDAQFYMFSVASGGSYAIQQLKGDGDWATLHDWTDSAAVRPLGEVNRLRVECLGERMRFYVNGELLAEVADLTLRSGTIGLAVSAATADEVEVRFDNVRLETIKKL